MKAMICTECRDYGRPARKKRGSDGIAIAAWFVFPLGLPYTIWRMFSKQTVCRRCGSTEVIDADSVVGQKLVERMLTDIANAPKKEPINKPPQSVDKNQMELTLPKAKKPEPEEAVAPEPVKVAPQEPLDKRKDPNVW